MPFPVFPLNINMNYSFVPAMVLHLEYYCDISVHGTILDYANRHEHKLSKLLKCLHYVVKVCMNLIINYWSIAICSFNSYDILKAVVFLETPHSLQSSN